jgi:hypothetical protein
VAEYAPPAIVWCDSPAEAAGADIWQHIGDAYGAAFEFADDRFVRTTRNPKMKERCVAGIP